MWCFSIPFCSTVQCCHCAVHEVDKKTLLSTVWLKASQYICLHPMQLIEFTCNLNETLHLLQHSRRRVPIMIVQLGILKLTDALLHCIDIISSQTMVPFPPPVGPVKPDLLCRCTVFETSQCASRVPCVSRRWRGCAAAIRTKPQRRERAALQGFHVG